MSVESENTGPVAVDSLQGLLEDAVNLVNAQRGLIAACVPDSQDMRVEATFGLDKETAWDNGQISQTLLRRVANQRRGVLTHDALEDKRFSETTSVILTGLRSTMCEPVVVNDEVWGVLYVDNLLRSGAFMQKDLKKLKDASVRLGKMLSGEAARRPLSRLKYLGHWWVAVCCLLCSAPGWADGLVYSPDRLSIHLSRDVYVFHPVSMAMRVASDPYVSLTDPAMASLLQHLHASIVPSADLGTLTVQMGTWSATWDVNAGHGTVGGQPLTDARATLVRNGEVVLSATGLSALLGMALFPLDASTFDYQLVASVHEAGVTRTDQGLELKLGGPGLSGWKAAQSVDGALSITLDNTECRLPPRTRLSGVTVDVVSHGSATTPTRLALTLDALWKATVAVDKVLLTPPVPATAAHVTSTVATIVLDAGHGGSDPGAISPLTGLREKDVTLEVARRLQKELETRGWKVLMTRSDDHDLTYPGSPDDLELGAWAAVADAPDVDLFVSIHCNASLSEEARGTSIHWYKPEDLPLAQTLSADLGAHLGIPMNGTEQSPFYVLRHTRVPAVLVETAYITNPQEGGLLSQPAFQALLAECMANALSHYVQTGGVHHGKDGL